MRATTWDLPGVRVRLARTGEVAAGEWAELYARMDPKRQARCDRYRRREDRRLCILADALARLALAQDTGADPGHIAFDREAGGKPYAVGLTGTSACPTPALWSSAPPPPFPWGRISSAGGPSPGP